VSEHQRNGGKKWRHPSPLLSVNPRVPGGRGESAAHRRCNFGMHATITVPSPAPGLSSRCLTANASEPASAVSNSLAPSSDGFSTDWLAGLPLQPHQSSVQAPASKQYLSQLVLLAQGQGPPAGPPSNRGGCRFRYRTTRARDWHQSSNQFGDISAHAPTPPVRFLRCLEAS